MDRTTSAGARVATPATGGAAVPAGDTGRGGLLRAFRVLENDAYRALWLGMLAVFAAMQVSVIARGYLAFQLSGSAAALGLVMLARGVPQLVLSPLGGVVADRMDKRRLLVLTQAAMTVTTALTAALVLLDRIAIWQLVLIGAIEGGVWVFNMPARQALVPELVGDNELMNAIALNSAGFNASRIAGPAAAGALIGAWWCGVGGVLLLAALGYGVFIFSLLRLPATPPRPARHRPAGSVFAQIGSGFRYTWGNRPLLLLMVMGAVPIVFGMSYQTLLPVFQERVLHVGPGQLGLLYAAAGLGALAGALTLATLAGSHRRNVLQIGFGVAFGVALIVFARMPVFGAALAAVALVGFAGNAFTAMNSTLIMTTADRAYHGRVISIYEMLWSLMLFASLPIGVAVDHFGAPVTVAVFGALVALVVLALSPARLKRARPEPAG